MRHSVMREWRRKLAEAKQISGGAELRPILDTPAWQDRDRDDELYQGHKLPTPDQYYDDMVTSQRNAGWINDHWQHT